MVFVLVSIDFFLLQVEIFLVLGMTNDFSVASWIFWLLQYSVFYLNLLFQGIFSDTRPAGMVSAIARWK